MAGELQGTKAQVATAGTAFGACEMDTADNLNLRFKDAVAGTKTLSELLNTVASHSVAGHSDLGTDFATQYYNAARLQAYLNTAANAAQIYHPADALSNGNLSAHVQDARLHQQVPKFVLRVAKSGQTYSTIQAAIDAIPTSGADSPSATQWYEIQVSPGTYAELVTMNKQFVQITGMGSRITRIRVDNTGTPSSNPLKFTASNTLVRDVKVESLNPSGGSNPAIVVNTGLSNVRVEDCWTHTPGAYGLLVQSGGSSIAVERSYHTSDTGAAVMVQGPVQFDLCLFDPGSTTAVALAVQSCTNVFVRRSRVEGATSILELLDATVTLEDMVASGTSPGMYVTNVSNTASTVTWVRTPGIDTATASNGTVTANQTTSEAIRTSGNVLIDWAVERSLKAGYGVNGTIPALADTIDATDHFFGRKLTTPALCGVAGHIMQIGDESTPGAGGPHTVSGVRVFLQALCTGKFLEWASRSSGVDTVLGYIARDGSVVARGVDASSATTATSADFNGSKFGATATHTSGAMAQLNGAVFNAPSESGAGTVVDAVAARFKAVAGVGTSKNLSALFEGATEFTGLLSANGEIVLPNGTASTNRVRVGSGYIYGDANTLSYKGVGYHDFNGSVYFHASTNADLAAANRNLSISPDSQANYNFRAYYNATVANRNVWIGPRLLVSNSIAAATSGATHQVGGTGNGLGYLSGADHYDCEVLECQKGGGDTIVVGDWCRFNSTAMSSNKPFVRRYDSEINLNFAGVAIAVSGNNITIARKGICKAFMLDATIGATIFPDHAGGGGTFYNGTTGLGPSINGYQITFGTALEAYSPGAAALKWVYVQPLSPTYF